MRSAQHGADAPTDGGPRTLAVDIGGTKMKAAIVSSDGRLALEPVLLSTPQPSPPASVLEALGELVRTMPHFDRISVGFPGVVNGSIIATAPNLGTQQWAGFDLARALGDRYRVPVRVLNDAAIQGLGVVQGPGLETVITLGTGVGCAVYRNRHWLLHLELALDAYIGNAVLADVGVEEWNERVHRTFDTVRRLTSCQRLYVGGGNARKVSPDLPAHVKLVSNRAGLTGGVRLWEAEFDGYFVGADDTQGLESRSA